MKGFLRHLTMSAASVVLISGFTAGSASFARAQQAASQADDGGHAAGPATAQPDKKKPPPYNFNGCWDGSSIVGSLEDENYGTGYGWIWIIQSGKNIKGGKNKNESYYEFVWDSGVDWAYGPLSGKATAAGFTATALAGGKCKAKIIAAPGTSDDIVGSYDFTHCKTKTSNFIAVGTFDLPLNDSGCLDIIP